MTKLETVLSIIDRALIAGRIDAAMAARLREEAGEYTPAYGTLLRWEGGVGYCAFTGNPVEW